MNISGNPRFRLPGRRHGSGSYDVRLHKTYFGTVFCDETRSLHMAQVVTERAEWSEHVWRRTSTR